ncbi:hypothetical protein B0J13DRAFT_523696 [Dactylonectria estremocensis]|uniref:Mitochondrial inner membrane protein 1 n=1 Tax=Dactylonectria estremocensis TaxID=1079267 RepID=A0A9P9EZF3_9HYPO|nr:hypothetical protein B0J13DRAFT_523696 [Dactylonectria estremocensis]
MFRIPRSIVRLTPRVSSIAPGGRVSVRLPPTGYPQAYRAALFASKPPNQVPPPPNQTITPEHEKKVAQEKLESDPSAVTTESSVRHVIEKSQAPENDDIDMSASLRHDIHAVRDTLSFRNVPRRYNILGLAGTLPYMGTSLSTLFLSWNLNKDLPTGNSLLDSVFVDHDTARHLLDVIEPIQLGYGAAVISCLGAAHWLLEYIEKQPQAERRRFRYTVGLAASAVAWPTLYLSVEYALTAQFMTFVALYFVDTKATARGWAPQWYATYRFLLTAMVGLAIFFSLVGRAKIDQTSSHSIEKRITTAGLADHETDWATLEKEEMARIKKEKEEARKKAEKEEQERKQKEMKSKKDGKGSKASDENGNEDGAKKAENGEDAETNKSETSEVSDDEGQETPDEDSDDEKEESSDKEKK